MNYYQQGDVLLKEAELQTLNVKEILGDLVHKGQNHHHRIRGDFSLLQDGADFLVHAKGECALFHEEHKEIVIPAGFYKKSIVVEYDHFLEESREVID